MNVEESNLEELVMSLNPVGDDPETEGGDNGEGGDDPKK